MDFQISALFTLSEPNKASQAFILIIIMVSSNVSYLGSIKEFV